jgi:hypothetical protein
MTTRKGRGRAAETTALIDAIVAIAREIAPCSVRALAYQLFNRRLIPSMERKHTKRVSELCVIAREEDLLEWELITDATRAEEKVATWADPAAFARAVQHSYRRNKWAEQPTHVSVWSEKATVAGTIQSVLERFEVPLVILHGWSGATPIHDAASANLGRRQRTVILYIGDYDPSGMFMSEMDLPKRLARYSSNAPADKDVDIAWARRALAEMQMEIRRIALTKADTVALGPATRFPAASKQSDSRYAWFIKNHGRGCWELDALSPATLRERLEEEILAELDRDAWDRYVRVEELEREAIAATCRAWTSKDGQVPK